MAVDLGKLNEFLGRFVGDLGATMAAAVRRAFHQVLIGLGKVSSPVFSARYSAATTSPPAMMGTPRKDRMSG